MQGYSLTDHADFAGEIKSLRMNLKRPPNCFLMSLITSRAGDPHLFEKQNLTE